MGDPESFKVMVVGHIDMGLTTVLAQMLMPTNVEFHRVEDATLPSALIAQTYEYAKTLEYLEVAILEELDNLMLHLINSLDYALYLPKRCLKKAFISILCMCRRSLHPT
jgi:hypothetical protein